MCTQLFHPGDGLFRTLLKKSGDAYVSIVRSERWLSILLLLVLVS